MKKKKKEEKGREEGRGRGGREERWKRKKRRRRGGGRGRRRKGSSAVYECHSREGDVITIRYYHLKHTPIPINSCNVFECGGGEGEEGI